MTDQSTPTTQNQQTLGQQEQLRTPAAQPAGVPEVVPLPHVLRQIGRDSRRDPQQYLDETIVPFGGE